MDTWSMTFEQGYGANMSLRGGPRDDTVAFQEWRSKQNADILDRGRSPVKDFEDEERYIQRMIKSVLRSHICYREVDEYADCLTKHNITTDEDLAQKGLVDVNLRLAQEKCPRAVAKYTSCIEARANHETVVSAATTHERCESKRKDFLICLRRYNAAGAIQERNCYFQEYFPLLRCGLNALFDEYWKGVTGYTPATEMHFFEVENDAKIKRKVTELRSRLEMESHLQMGGEGVSTMTPPLGPQARL